MGTTWDDICKSVDGWTKKANRKMEQMTEAAAIRIKISAKKAEMEDAYLALGKLTYENAQGADVTDAMAKKMTEITALQTEIDALENKLGKEKETKVTEESEETAEE